MKNILQSINKFFAVLFPFHVIIRGVKVYYNSMDRMVAAYLWKFGWLEGYEMSLFHSCLKPGQIMLDIGANMGVYSLTASNIIGDAGKIIAFEPDDDNFKVLKKNILKNEFKNIDPVPYAVSDKEETIFFETHSLNSGNHQIRKEKTEHGQTSIQAICLDNFLPENQKVDIIKIDIQGAEFYAFLGMKKLLSNNPNVIIFSEYWTTGLRNLGIEPSLYINLLKSFDFYIYKIDNKNRKLIKLSYDEIKNNPEYEKNYLNFILTKGDLNFLK
jgi:FkbM family methyltransferase